MDMNSLSLLNDKLCFEGCDDCGAKCCASNLIYVTLYDFETVAKYFPIFFRIKENNISLIFFFYNKTDNTKFDKKCIYLQNNLCSIYNDRPYACRSFPFSYSMQSSDFTYSNECAYIKDISIADTTKNILPFIKNNKINDTIINNFVTQNFIHYAKDIQNDTEEFINFAVNNNLLIKFKDVYKEQKYDNFQNNYFDELYIFNKIKISILNLKKKELFENNTFLDYIKAQLHSMSNVEKML